MHSVMARWRSKIFALLELLRASDAVGIQATPTPAPGCTSQAWQYRTCVLRVCECFLLHAGILMRVPMALYQHGERGRRLAGCISAWGWLGGWGGAVGWGGVGGAGWHTRLHAMRVPCYLVFGGLGFIVKRAEISTVPVPYALCTRTHERRGVEAG